MRRSRAAADESKEKLVCAAAAQFRLLGYAGAGVDQIAARAGVTSGAFYRHFASKEEIFALILKRGFEDFAEGIRAFKEKGEPGEKWRADFAEFYFSRRRRDCIAEGCVLPSLAEEVVRAGNSPRQAFAEGLDVIATELGGGRGSSRRPQILAALATMAGGVTLSRASNSPELQDEIAEAAVESVRRALLDIGSEG